VSNVERLAAQNGHSRLAHRCLRPTAEQTESYDAGHTDDSEPAVFIPRRFKAGELEDEFPELDPPIIEGLVREGETINIVSVSKVGKSWLTLGLGFCVVTGQPWLGRFDVRRGRFLLIDNELRPPTLSHRLKSVAQAMGIRRDEYQDALEILPIRGLGWTIFEIAAYVENQIERFNMIAIDAKYRTVPFGKSENDNASETMFYNEVDKLAEKTRSAIALIHHASKGSQAEKRTTDVGAGAGAQSRAADSHVVLKEHEDANTAVLDAAIRSFKPIAPIGLRFEFPIWTADESIDIELLKGRLSKSEEKSVGRDIESDRKVLDACQTWATRRELRKTTGFGDGRLDRAIARLVDQCFLEPGTVDRKHNPGCEAFRKTIHAS
jgi:hypothetical protein